MGADPFVGREAEIAALEEALAGARSGRGRLFLVGGEPGIGKSRLATELTARARAAGAQVAWGRCWEAGGAPPYWPWVEALTAAVDRLSVAGLRAELGPDADDLAEIVPSLALGDTPEVDVQVAPDTARFRLFDAVVRLCRLATADVPMVVVVDDIHVADLSSLLLLQFLAGHLDTMSLMVVASYRDTDAGSDGFARVLAELLREPNTTRLRLRGLDEHEVAELVTATTGVDAPPPLVSRFRDLTEGNPLYIGEAARLLVTEGRFDVDSDRLALPRDVRETVLQRLAYLSPASQHVLRIASVLGRDFPIDLLVALVGGDVDVMAALDEAASADLVADSPGRSDQLRFGHAVMSEALYAEIPALQRRRLHDHARQELEELETTDVELRLAELAKHSCASLPFGPSESAVMYARLAAERAVRQRAYEEGARLFRMALRAAEGSATATAAGIEERAELLLALGDALSKGGDIAAAQGTFLDAADLARRSGDADKLARAALEYGGRFVWMRAGTDRHLIPLLLEALAAVPDVDSEVRVRLLARLSGAKRDEASGAARDGLSAEAVAIAERLGDPATLSYALLARGLATNSPQSSWEQLEFAERAISLAELAHQPEQAAAARLFRFLALLATGPGEAVRPALDDYTRMADELRQPSHRWYSDVVRGSVLLMEGRLDDAEALMRTARGAGERAQSWDAGATHLLALAMLRWEQGRLPELEESLVSAPSLYPGYRLFRCLLALACLEAGRPDEASGLAEEIVDGGDQTLPRDNGWLFGMTMLAEIAARLDHAALAARLHAPLLPYAELVGTGAAEIPCGSVERPLGQLAAVLGNTAEALARFDTARAVDRRYRADIWVTHTDVEESVARLRRDVGDDRAVAAELVAGATDACARRGWVALGARVESLRTQLDRSHRSADLPGGLTRREVEVARLVANGRSNREIAAEFVLSERTVESHVQHILTKLSFTSRAEVAAWVVRSGLDGTG